MKYINNNRENLEWLNFWWQDANCDNSYRILGIGDSVMRQYRSSLQMLLNDNEPKIAVDYVGSSSSIADTLLYEELQFFLNHKEYKYSLILLDLGAHHGLNLVKDGFCDYKDYKNYYINIINLLKKTSENLFIITATPQVDKNKLTKIDDILNAEIIKRNELIKEIAESCNIPIIDLYTIVYISVFNEKKYKYVDGFHLQRTADDFIASIILEHIAKYLSNDNNAINIDEEVRKKIIEADKINAMAVCNRNKNNKNLLKRFLSITN